MKHLPLDATGAAIRIGDSVRVVGVPDLSGMSSAARAESLPVFHYLVGRYKRVSDFDALGLAELCFRIPQGPQRGHHTVWLEPQLLRVRRSRAVE